MSIAITIESIQGPIKVEIHRDGTLSGEDLPEVIDYDRAMVEFGEKESQLLEFVDSFDKDPLLTIFGPRWIDHVNQVFMGRYSPFKIAFLVGADYVKHVKNIDQETSSLIQESIDSLEEFLSQGYPDDDSELFRIRISKLNHYAEQLRSRSKDYLNEDAEKYIAVSAHHLLKAVLEDGFYSMMDLITRSWRSAQGAAGYSSYRISDRQAFSEIYILHEDLRLLKIQSSESWMESAEREAAWQFRRLIDVMDALHDDKGWPPLEATE